MKPYCMSHDQRSCEPSQMQKDHISHFQQSKKPEAEIEAGKN